MMTVILFQHVEECARVVNVKMVLQLLVQLIYLSVLNHPKMQPLNALNVEHFLIAQNKAKFAFQLDFVVVVLPVSSAGTTVLVEVLYVQVVIV